VISFTHMNTGIPLVVSAIGTIFLLTPLHVIANTLSITASAPQYCPRLPQNLFQGMRDSGRSKPGITELQKFFSRYYNLNPDINVTGYFGIVTRKNVIRFQREQNLPAYGVVGPLTRATIAKVCGGTGEPQQIPSSNPTGATPETLDSRPSLEAQASFMGDKVIPRLGLAPLRVQFAIWYAGAVFYLDYGDETSLKQGDTDGLCTQNSCTPWHTYSSPGTYVAKLKDRWGTIVDTATISVMK